MRKLIYLLVSYTICFSCLWAQEKVGILQGKVTDTKGAGAENATVLLLNRVDSTYISGTITDLDGNFRMDKIQPDSYLIEIGMLGYKKKYLTLQIEAGSTHEPATIMLEEDSHELAAIVVLAGQQPIKTEAGKMIVDLSSSILGSQGNALDALKNLPGVMVRDDGTIYMNGQAGVNVLIDDKQTYLSGESLINYLQALPSTSISKIELLTHPSSQYDASGNSGLINIRRKKVDRQGLNISVNSNYQQGKYARGSENLNLSVRKSKWNIYADYSFNWGKDLMEVESSRNYIDPVSFRPTGLMLDMIADRRFKYSSHYLRGGVDYDLSDRIVLGVYATGNWYDHLKNEEMSSDFSINYGPTDSMLVSTNRYHTYTTNLTGGASMIYNFMEDAKWDVSFDFQRFDTDYNQVQQSLFSLSDQLLNRDTLRGDTKGGINIYTGQTNLSYPLSDKFILQAGLKTAFISIDNHSLYQNRHHNVWMDNTHLSNSFFYDENINAGYLQLKAKLSPRLSIEAGLRLENTNVKGRQSDLIADEDSLFTDHYTHLFPTLSTQFNLSEDHSFSLTYGRRIIRPNYRDLNPFVEVNDRYLHEQGNTNLKAELSDNIELSYYLKQKYSMTLFYSYRQKPITKSYLMGDDNTILVMPTNLSSNHLAGVRVGLNNMKPFHWWALHINGTFMYRQFSWNLLGIEDTNQLVTPMVSVNNQFILPFNWSAELTGYYNGKIAEGQANLHPMWMVSAGLSKRVLKNKGTLKLFVNDIFDSNKVHIDIFSPFQHGWYKEITDRREVGMSFTYRFNSGSGTKDTRRDNRIDESKRINL